MADLQSAVQRWFTQGLSEWIQTDDDGLAYDKYDRGNTHPRLTVANTPQFLPRLKSHLERQFHFTYELIE